MGRSDRSAEHDLVDRARAGDGEALRALLERHEASLRRRLDRSVPPPLRRPVSVADVMQETWLVAFRRTADFDDRGDGAFDAWLAAIADLKLREAVRHHLLTEKRAGSREITRGARPNSSAFADREPSPSDAAIGEETRERAERAMAGLPEDYRQGARPGADRGTHARRRGSAHGSFVRSGEEALRSRGVAAGEGHATETR